ncbi:MAG: NAD-dependent epimerase/dehydratase family protein [Bryobacter sp.]|nr:NAD-dependent epimerase/dehydratase family protein [Bryobacter sp.]
MNPGPSAASFWSKKQVFVTGATGLVGGWLVSSLVEHGASVTALVRDGSPRSHLRLAHLGDRIRTVGGSFCDAHLLERVLGAQPTHTIIHLGAQTVVGVANSDPVTTFEVNARGTWNLLDAARRHGVHQTLIASTLLVSATDSQAAPGQRNVLGEAMLQHPYAVSKVCMERIASAFAHTYLMRLGILRFGNIYGGGDLHFSRLIPGAIRSTLRGEHFRFRTPGASERDFLYVEDAVSAYLRFGELLATSDTLCARPVAFGLGSRVSLLNLVRLILKHADRADLEPITGTSSTPEISEEATDIHDACKLLGWRPQHTLDEGMQRTIAWFRNYFEIGQNGYPLRNAPVQPLDRN